MKKTDKLTNIIKELKSVLVAYSGGVDSTYLLKTAIDTIGTKNVLAVIASSETYPEHEKKEALELCNNLGAKCMVIETEELNDPKFKSNPNERCYYCKTELFSKLIEIAKEKNIPYVVDGSNADDQHDFRPGTKAKEELGIRSPLQEAKLTKSEIRALSKELGLSTWDKPSYACLASRIPYGTEIKSELLVKIGEAENYLRELGFGQLRVRHHGNLARIEIERQELPGIMKDNLMDKINKRFGELGYIYVTLDLKGYRTGSMNEVLAK
jgi:uncharacterized protein